MRYAAGGGLSARETVRVVSGDDVTFIAWRAEGGQREYGLRWRELCAANGIVDPMQAALPGGERLLLGERLRMGQELTR